MIRRRDPGHFGLWSPPFVYFLNLLRDSYRCLSWTSYLERCIINSRSGKLRDPRFVSCPVLLSLHWWTSLFSCSTRVVSVPMHLSAKHSRKLTSLQAKEGNSYSGPVRDLLESSSDLRLPAIAAKMTRSLFLNFWVLRRSISTPLPNRQVFGKCDK